MGQSTWSAFCSIHRLLIPTCTPERPCVLISFFLHSWDPHFAGGVAWSPRSQVSCTCDLCSSSGTQGQAGNLFSLAAPCSLQPLRYRQETPKIVPKSPAAASGVTCSICANRAATGEGLAAVAAGSWRVCSSSTPSCHPVKYFTGH